MISLFQHTSRPKCLTTFQNNRLFNININPTDHEYNKPNFKVEVIKQEVNTDITIKEEVENIIINDSDIIHSDSDDDNRLLIDYSNKEKDKNKTIKKQQRKNNVLKDKIKTLKQTSIVRKKRKNGGEFYKEIELTKEEIDLERKELSLQEEYVNAMFRCEQCIVSFPNADDLKDHLNTKHQLVSFLISILTYTA